jgi:CTD small phosphatase-like protein 2
MCLSFFFSCYVVAAMGESTEFLQLILSGNDEGYSNTTELQVWDVLDFYFSESFSDVQFDSIMGFTNDVGTSSYDCMNIVDLVERPVALLSLNDTEEPNNATNKASADNSTVDPDDTSLYLQMKPLDSETESISASHSVIGTAYVDEKLQSRGLPDLMDVDSPYRLRKSPVRTKHVTLVLDLDGKQAITWHYSTKFLNFFISYSNCDLSIYCHPVYPVMYKTEFFYILGSKLYKSSDYIGSKQ